MKETWIYWRRPNDTEWRKSYVQEIVKTTKGDLYELAPDTWWTRYPTRLLLSEIEVL